MSPVSEQFEEQLEDMEKQGLKIAGKVGLKVFAFVLVKPTSAGLSALSNKIKESNEKANISINELNEEGVALKDIEISDENIKAFEPMAKKYGIKYSLKELHQTDENGAKQPPTYMVFFKAKDESVMNMALKEFSQREAAKSKKNKVKVQNPKKDVKKSVNKFKDMINNRPVNPLNKNKNKER